MLPLNDMMLFMDVVKYKSFTAAADKNEKTAAAISKRVSQLEKELGVELLQRTTRTLALTAAGKVLYDYCCKIQSDTQCALDKVFEAHKNPKGKIKLSALPNVTNLVIAPILDRFLSLYQDVEIEISFDGALGPVPQVGDYDLALRSGKLGDSSVIARKLFSHSYVVCASPQYLSNYGTPLTLDDLAEHNCIDCRHGTKSKENTWVFFDGTEQHYIPVKGSIHTNNAQLIRSLAVNHVALIYSPSFIVADDINNGLLVPLLQQYKTIENPIWIVHSYSTRNLPKRLRLFIDYLFDNIRIPTINLQQAIYDTSQVIDLEGKINALISR